MKNYWAIIKNALNVNSSHIADVIYNESENILTITWQNGRRYEYYKVPKSIHDELINAPSKGKFFNLEIRGSFDFKEVL